MAKCEICGDETDSEELHPEDFYDIHYHFLCDDCLGIFFDCQHCKKMIGLSEKINPNIDTWVCPNCHKSNVPSESDIEIDKKLKIIELIKRSPVGNEIYLQLKNYHPLNFNTFYTIPSIVFAYIYACLDLKCQILPEFEKEYERLVKDLVNRAIHGACTLTFSIIYNYEEKRIFDMLLTDEKYLKLTNDPNRMKFILKNFPKSVFAIGTVKQHLLYLVKKIKMRDINFTPTKKVKPGYRLISFERRKKTENSPNKIEYYKKIVRLARDQGISFAAIYRELARKGFDDWTIRGICDRLHDPGIRFALNAILPIQKIEKENQFFEELYQNEQAR